MEYDRLYKIIVVGDSGAGKTQIVSQFCNEEFTDKSPPTVIMEHTRKVLKKSRICAHIWDLAGRDIFRTVTTCYFKGALAAIVVYDVTKVRSFENAQRWIDNLRQTLNSEPPVIMLLGNKLDLRHQQSVSAVEGYKLSRDKMTLFFEVSAKDGTNIKEAFTALVDQVTEKINQEELRRDVNMGAGLQSGARALKQTKASMQIPDCVIQSQPGSSVRQTAQQCLESAKESCCKNLPCCW